MHSPFIIFITTLFAWRTWSRTRSGSFTPPLLGEKCEEILHCQSIEHIARGQPALARDSYAVVDVLQSVGCMRIRTDRYAHAALGGESVPAPVEVKAIGIGVQLNGHTQLTRARDDALQIGRIAV